MKKIIPLLFLIFILTSCSQKSNENVMNDIAMGNEEIMPVARQQLKSSAPPPAPPTETKEVVKKKIIKDGRLGLKVQDINSAKAGIDALVKNYEGYRKNTKDFFVDFTASAFL